MFSTLGALLSCTLLVTQSKYLVSGDLLSNEYYLSFFQPS